MCDTEETTGLVSPNPNYNSMYPGTTSQAQNPYEPYGGNPDVESPMDNHLSTEQGEFVSLSKSNNIRLNFIRKVYAILAMQLIVTWAGVFTTAYNEPVREYLLSTIWLLIIAVIISLVSCYALVCYPPLATRVPTNFILLTIFTLAESYLVSTLTAAYSSEDVLIATTLTATVVVALSLYACYTKTDFTMIGGLLFCAL
jgi:FtsH-binding integral membrane protein